MDEQNKKLVEFINAIGSMAEVTKIYREGLIKCGIPIDEVKTYTVAFIQTIFRRQEE